MHRFHLEAVSDARLGDDDPRLIRIALELPPQVTDVHAQILLCVARHVPPDVLEQSRVRDGAMAMPFDPPGSRGTTTRAIGCIAGCEMP